MPPRYAYWTILAGGLPTSFRAASSEDLLPTLRRLKERHPDAEMKWFARGKLWASPEAARAEPRSPSVARSRDWRPGGEHKDPREKYKTAKRDQNLVRREQRFKRKHAATDNAPAPRETPQPRSGRTSSRPIVQRSPDRRPDLRTRPSGSAQRPAAPRQSDSRSPRPPVAGRPWRETSPSRERRPDRKGPPKGGRGR